MLHIFSDVCGYEMCDYEDVPVKNRTLVASVVEPEEPGEPEPVAYAVP